MTKVHVAAAALGAALALAAGIAVAVPAIADNESTASTCLSTVGDAGPTLNLDAVPTLPVTGKLAVRGVGEDDDDDHFGDSRGHRGEHEGDEGDD